MKFPTRGPLYTDKYSTWQFLWAGLVRSQSTIRHYAYHSNVEDQRPIFERFLLTIVVNDSFENIIEIRLQEFLIPDLE